MIGIVYIVLFGIGHCIPIAVAGSSTATVRKLLENSSFHEGSQWFRKCAGAAIGILGIYFVIRPFLDISWRTLAWPLPAAGTAAQSARPVGFPVASLGSSVGE